MSSDPEAFDIGDLPVSVKSISIEGQKHTSSKFIFSELDEIPKSTTFAEMNQKIYESIQSLKSTNIFNDVNVIVDTPSASKHENAIDMNIAFVLKEKSRLGFSFGFNQTTDSSSARGSLSTHIRNVVGHGDTLDISYASTDLKLNGSNKSISALLRDIRPFSSKSTAFIGVSSETQDNAILSSFLNHSTTIRTGITSTNKKHSFEYNFSHRQLTPIIPKLGSVGQSATSSIVNETLLPTNKSSIRYTYRDDNRVGDILLPDGGHFIQFTSEVAGLPGSDVAFVKGETTLQHFSPFGPFVLGITGRAGLIRPLGSGRIGRYADESITTAQINTAYDVAKAPELPPINLIDRFTQHSMFVRGYSPSEIGPKHGADVLGGDCYTSAGVSITAPLPYAKTSIKPHVFFNTGNLISLVDWLKQNSSERSKNPLVSNPLSTVGFGFILPTILGRLELNFVSAIKDGKVSKPKFSLVAGMDY